MLNWSNQLHGLGRTAEGEAGVEFRVLGPLEVIEDGRSLGLGSPQQRALLALLVLHAGRVVSMERILEELWGDEVEGKEQTLWVYVSRLRAALEPTRETRTEDGALITRDHGYVLDVDLSTIDCHVFEQKVTAARAGVRHDPAAASSALSDALGLWRGSALEGVGDYFFAQVEAVRLNELRVTALGDRVEADLRRGLTAEPLADLEVLLREDPLREIFITYQMLALYRSGRHAEALRAFERYRRQLDEELGVVPSPELRGLEEEVLLHAPAIHARLGGTARPTVELLANPFKGLRPFVEEDAGDFFGRDRVVAEVVRRLGQGERCVALIGPSGSGKSSVVRAGLIPALRKSAVEGSDSWVLAQLMPGVRPFAELEAALLRSSFDAPRSLSEQLANGEGDVLRAVLRVLPDESSRLMLFIDQFEELFTSVRDEAERVRFISGLVELIDDPRGRCTVVLTLRADFYGQILDHAGFADRMGSGVINVVPLAPAELEEAAQGPATAAGVALAPGLLASLLADVLGQPGALPLFQFALTELFDRRSGPTLTVDEYQAMGGLNGALSRRADELYAGMPAEQQDASRQLFLRLVSISENHQWGRRRIPASEIVSLGGDLVTTQVVIEQFTRLRFLTVDRDPVTGSPTIDLAHEALLAEWPRLSAWINESSADLVQLAKLAAATQEWSDADLHPDFLLTGSRLKTYEEWAATASVALTADQRDFLGAAGDRRDADRQEQVVRISQDQKAQRAARRRLWAFVATVGVAIALGAGLFMLVDRSNPTRVAVVAPSARINGTRAVLETGAANAERDLDVEVELLTGSFTSLEDQYRTLAEDGTELIFLDPDNSGWDYVQTVIEDHPDAAFAVIDGILPAIGARSVYFADNEAAFVAGVAAALTTETGVVGFVGGHQTDPTERWRAGFEAGVHAIDPLLDVLAIYATTQSDGVQSVENGRVAAHELFDRNADVILAFARGATLGVVEAAAESNRGTGPDRWVIGSEVDWTIEVGSRLRPSLLTSALRKQDVALVETIRAFADGVFTVGVFELGLAEGAVGLASSEQLPSDDLAVIASLSSQVASGEISIPVAPRGELLPPAGGGVVDTVTISWSGETCNHAGPPLSYPAGSTVRVNFENASSENWELWAFADGPGILLSLLAGPASTSIGYFSVDAGQIELGCVADSRAQPEGRFDRRLAATLTATSD
jgi:basic membrane lipoprotein Med (substrate-binding protein (PBP1-ABC) superfamily)/DNA-binding SARP family transcriptional activator